MGRKSPIMKTKLCRECDNTYKTVMKYSKYCHKCRAIRDKRWRYYYEFDTQKNKK